MSLDKSFFSIHKKAQQVRVFSLTLLITKHKKEKNHFTIKSITNPLSKMKSKKIFLWKLS